MDETTSGRPLSRRGVIGLGLGAAAGGLVVPAAAGVSPAARPERRRIVRIAHLTDVHVQPERGAADGFAAALRFVQSMADPPDILLTGGDAIMDALGADRARTAAQWAEWDAVVRNEVSLPIRHCIGNHDIWGWYAGSGTTGDEPEWGKAWALDAFGMDRRYGVEAMDGWWLVTLDSVQPSGGGYDCFLDEAQYAWLAETLRALDAGEAVAGRPAAGPDEPVVILLHVPILTVTGHIYDGRRVEGGHHRIPTNWVHRDAKRLKDLFLGHPRVRCVLSGHMHLADHCVYAGVHHVCSGAVCGGWWGGDSQECDEGIGLIDLHDDGTVDVRYVGYGWTPRD
jgi:3',5'-cyclic AMP phosphodiesterase CpdA